MTLRPMARLHDDVHASYGWTGSQSSGEGDYAWTDGSKFDFEDWVTNEPNNAFREDLGHTETEDCVHTKTNVGSDGDDRGGRWNDRPCEDTNADGRESWCGPADAVTGDGRYQVSTPLSHADCPDSTVARFSSFKFNLDPADDKTGLRGWDCCIQLSEINLYSPAGKVAKGATATNTPGIELPLLSADQPYFVPAYVKCSHGMNPCGEMPQNALDGNTVSLHGCANCNHKWLDFTRGDLIMTFESPKTVASYDWLTANDAPNRDPIKWTLEGSNDDLGDRMQFSVVDETYASVAFSPTEDRYAWQGPFCITSDGIHG